MFYDEDGSEVYVALLFAWAVAMIIVGLRVNGVL